MTDWCSEISGVYEVDHRTGRDTVDSRKNLLWVLERMSPQDRRLARVTMGRIREPGDYVYDALKLSCGETTDTPRTDNLEWDTLGDMTPTTPTLDPTLAAILSRHCIAPTVDALLAEFEARDQIHSLDFGGIYEDMDTRWRCRVWDDLDHGVTTYLGSTAILALARAFAAIVEEGE